MPLTVRDVTLHRHDAVAALAILDSLCTVYADAYGVDPDEHKPSAFRQRATKALEHAGFELVTARDRHGCLVGFAFGYPLPEGDTHWWSGLTPIPEEGFMDETGRRTFVLAEIEVRRAVQGSGIGKAIHDALLSNRCEERATLATNPLASATQAIYERWGWRRVGQVPGSSGDYYDAYDLLLRPLTAR